MTNKQSKQHRTPLFRRPWMLALMVVVAIIIIVILVIVFAKPPHAEEKGNDDPATTNSESSQNGQNEEKPQESSIKNEDRPEDKVTQFEGEDPNDLEGLTGVVTYKGVENGDLIIDTSIDQYLTNGGTCQVTVKGQDTGRVETATRPAHADITTSYCETFTIPVANLPADYYEIEIIVSGDDKKGTIKDGVQI